VFTMERRLVLDVAKVHGKGKVQIPSETRKRLNVKDGDRVYFILDPEGRIILEKAPSMETKRLGKY